MYTSHSQIFSDSVKALARRGWKRSANRNGTCKYGGIGCAIGVLRGVGKYAEKWDKCKVPTIAEISQDRPKEVCAIFSRNINIFFLSDLQIAHDSSLTEDEMKQAFNRVASEWRLWLPKQIRKLLA